MESREIISNDDFMQKKKKQSKIENFRQINSLVISPVQMLLSRIFCEKCVRLNLQFPRSAIPTMNFEKIRLKHNKVSCIKEDKVFDFTKKNSVNLMITAS